LDSLTQVVLGGCVAAAVVPAAHRRRAAWTGALLGTLPDLDSFPLRWLGADAVTTVTWHRGPSHSLPVLLLVALALWWLLRRHWQPVRVAPGRWLAAISLALWTHPLLDAFTVYGTQLWWPLSDAHPAMWSSVFIIDPAYTLPLLLGFGAAVVLGARPAARGLVLLALLLSSGYLGWSLWAKHLVERAAVAALAPLGLQDAPRFSVPMPFSTLMWRVVVMTPEQTLEGYRALAVDRAPMRFAPIPSEPALLAPFAVQAPVARLLWFSSGFMTPQIDGNRLLLSDLRMGSHPYFNFRYQIAERASAQARWQPLTPTFAPIAVPYGPALRAIWQRTWHEPAADAPPFSLTGVATAPPNPSSPTTP
jgi:inner membrane protein